MTGHLGHTGQHRRQLRDLADLTDVVRELTAPRQHRQSYRAGWNRPNRTGPVIRDHISQQPSLLNELRACIVDRSGAALGARAGKITYTVLPRFSADAFDRLETIRAAVNRWGDRLDLRANSKQLAAFATGYIDSIRKMHLRGAGLKPPVAAALEVVANSIADINDAIELDLHGIVTNAPAHGPHIVDELAHDAERWRTWCRIMAGWETPALRPHVPCPHCGTIAGERAGLRVRIDGASGTGGMIDDAGVRAAVCLTCNCTWDADTVGLLAEQLRQAGQLLDGAA